MALEFRLAEPSEHDQLKELILKCFEPITYFKAVERKHGPLNGLDWRDRWRLRLRKVFDSQIILVGELDGQVVACSTGTVQPETALGYIDLLAVDDAFQGRGLGREMLRGMLRHLKELGAVHAHLECLTNNEVGNRLYESAGFEEVGRLIHWFIKIP